MQLKILMEMLQKVGNKPRNDSVKIKSAKFMENPLKWVSIRYKRIKDAEKGDRELSS